MIVAVPILMAATLLGQEPETVETAIFRDRIAPILESRCLSCHGGPEPKGGLSMESRAALLDGGAGGPVVEPGKPETSYLIDMVAGELPLMPPSGDPLPPEDVEAIRHWIAEGLPWPSGMTLRDREAERPLWSLAPLLRPRVPKVVSDHDRVRNPIDAFVRSRLVEHGLSPAPEADPRTLIRRVTFDLTGLPPTPSEIDAFLADESPDAYARLVDRLLASPRYGERWARHWLDVVHYADTHGYDKDKRRNHAWRYRDYVIRSLNEDVPYSRFIREQIAGDVLSPNDPDGIVATGFIAAGPWDFVGHVELREGTVDKKKTRLIDRDDMLANTMSTFVSMTVHCARCHDHKFDPIPQEDYYRLQAVFAGVDRGDRPFESAEIAARRADLERRRADLDTTLSALRARIDETTHPDLERLDAEIARRREQLAAMSPLTLSQPSPTNGYHSGIESSPDVTKWVQVDLGRPVPIDAILLVPARPTDFPDTPGFGFPVRYRVALSNADDFAPSDVIVDHSDADVPNPGDVPVLIKKVGKTARFVRVSASKLWERRNDFAFALGELIVLSAGRNVARGASVSALDSIEAGRWSRDHLVDGFNSRNQLADLDDPDVLRRLVEQSDIRDALASAEIRRVALKQSLIDPGTRDALRAAEAERAALDEQIASLPEPSLVYAVKPHDPRPIHVLQRGDVTQPGEAVGPGALSCVTGLDPIFDDTADEGARRAALAHWISHPDNPLTWRSIVNRVWHDHFGRGIVETPNDFGHNGAKPTHPDLLDWLAVTFRDSGGSLKALHRMIVLSSTYRQSTTFDEANARTDAGNRFLWRQNRRRLEAEEIRDAVLLVSGRLQNTMGGPGFALFRYEDDHSPIYDHDDPAWIDPPSGRRRTIYRFIVRSVPNPFLECLDGADPNTSVPVRNETITALQALALLNDPFMISQAEGFADRLKAKADDLDGQIVAAYRLALGRPPDDEERSAMVAFAQEHGLVNACRLIFNLNEFVFID